MRRTSASIYDEELVSRHHQLPLLLVVLMMCAASCYGGPDPRVATPQATVETMLRANHLWRVGLFEARLPRPPPDVSEVASCIWDYDRDDQGSRAMAEFVAGMLAAGQGQLEYRIGRSRAVVRTMHRSVYLRKSGNSWLIVLRDTVPDEIRQGLRRPVARRRREFDHEMP